MRWTFWREQWQGLARNEHQGHFLFETEMVFLAQTNTNHYRTKTCKSQKPHRRICMDLPWGMVFAHPVRVLRRATERCHPRLQFIHIHPMVFSGEGNAPRTTSRLCTHVRDLSSLLRSRLWLIILWYFMFFVIMGGDWSRFDVSITGELWSFCNSKSSCKLEPFSVVRFHCSILPEMAASWAMVVAPKAKKRGVRVCTRMLSNYWSKKVNGATMCINMIQYVYNMHYMQARDLSWFSPSHFTSLFFLLPTYYHLQPRHRYLIGPCPVAAALLKRFWVQMWEKRFERPSSILTDVWFLFGLGVMQVYIVVSKQMKAYLILCSSFFFGK